LPGAGRRDIRPAPFFLFRKENWKAKSAISYWSVITLLIEKGVFMGQHFEYRKDKNKGNAYNLYVDGKSTEYFIFGMEMPGMKMLWFADGGEGKKTMRQYPSLEAAFREEAELLEDVYQTGPIVLRGVPPGASALKPTVRKGYDIGSFLYPLLDSICDALANHCEKMRRYHIDTNYALPYWFKVTDAGEDGRSVIAEGSSLGCRFKFCFQGGRYSFSAETGDDVEHIFFHVS
jgi:hypothetical protein